MKESPDREGGSQENVGLETQGTTRREARASVPPGASSLQLEAVALRPSC